MHLFLLKATSLVHGSNLHTTRLQLGYRDFEVSNQIT